jgi:hypothetical protein
MNATPTRTPTAAIEQYGRGLWVRAKVAMAIGCAGCRAGRILLHLLCACGDHQFRWHLAGISREVAGSIALAG